MTPKVSVIIATYNYGRFVGQAIRSVLDQTWRDREVIVVDDGSTDDTAAVVRTFGDSVRAIHQANRGLSGARNTGLRAASGQYVAYLDSDDLWLPDKLARQVAVLDARPDVGLVYADALYFDDASGASLGRHGERYRHADGHVTADLITRGNFIPMATPLFRRSAVDVVGGFDETLRHSMDWDMWIRIAARWQFAYVPEVLARYRVHGRNMSRNTGGLRDAQLAILRKAFADPAVVAATPTVDRAAAVRAIYVDSALCHFSLEQYAVARTDLRHAVKADPRALLDPRVVGRLVVGSFGRPVVNALRAVKRALSPPRNTTAA